jgi:putative transposase
VADFTYVRLATGTFAYTAFVIDAYAGRIMGWECSSSKHTTFVERAIRQAVALRLRDEKPQQTKGTKAIQPIHHSDAGSQGGFNWSSQHFECGGVDGQASGLDDGVDRQVADEVAGQAVAATRRGAVVLA